MDLNDKQKIYSIEELNEIKQHSMILLASARNTGKSVLVKNLISFLLSKYEYNFIIIFSDTSEYEKEYDFIDIHFKTKDLDEKLKKIFKIQQKNKKNNNNISGIIILDDIIIDSNSFLLNQVASLGRHK